MDNLAYDYDYGRNRRVRYELLDGNKIMMSPGPSLNHNGVVRNLLRLFGNYLLGKVCVVYGDNTDVHLSEKDRVQPDLSVVCNRSILRANAVYGAPDLVVEVLSPSTEKRDTGYKMRLYAESGVKEYWLIRTTDKSVSVYLTVNGRFELAEFYVIPPVYELDEMTDEERSALVTEFSPFLFPDMKITLDEVFEDMLE